MNPIQPAPKDSKIEKSKSSAEDPKLKEACQEFEGMFLTQLITAMRSTTFKSDLFGESKEDDMYNSMLNEQYAQMMARQDNGSGSMANLLYEQLTGKK